MGLYRFEYWYRYANDDKDFATIDVRAESQEEADKLIRLRKRRVFKTVFIEKLD